MTSAGADRDALEAAPEREAGWRTLPASIALLGVLMLLTGFSVRSVNTDAELYDRLLAELDHAGSLEAALQRDALAARSGLLRTYDPLVLEARGLDADLVLLKGSPGEEAHAALERLAATVQRQERLIEEFKSSNALLQNSRAHFQLLSAQIAQRPGDAALMAGVRALAAAVLHLTLDTSPEASQEVSDCLLRLETAAARAATNDPVRGLLAHGRVLGQVLPAADAALRALSSAPEVRDREILRASLLKRQSASRASARSSYLILYAASVVLLALLLRLGVQLRSRALMLQRRAMFEHVIATISMRFVKAPVQESASEIARALGELADCVGSDRVYLTASAPYACSHLWTRDGVNCPPGWPARAAELARRAGRERGVVNVRNVARLADIDQRAALAAADLKGWTCASMVSEDGAQVILGLDAVQQSSRIGQGELSLLLMALDVIFNAVRRTYIDAEKERLQTRLQQARRMETVGALASGIAHNFNNIIGAILGYVELADLDRHRDGSHNLDEVRRAGERARELVEQILTFGARRDNRRCPVRLLDSVAEAVSMLRASLPQGIELDVGDVPAAAIVAAEPVQLQQVILNLCSNAAQAMGGAGRIELAAQIYSSDHECVLSHGRLPPGCYGLLSVSDSGCGIDARTLARIFEPFFTTRASGNGLGLATVHEIVSECEGAMHVVSTRGAGSRFEAWFPCLPLSALAPADIVASHSLGNGETLLVIDDNPAELLRSEDILAALGYEPVGFGAAEAVLRALPEASTRFDAAVIGRTNAAEGLAVAAALHERLPRLPVVLASAVIEPGAAASLARRHVLEIVHRPLITGEVAAALARSLPPQPEALVPRAH